MHHNNTIDINHDYYYDDYYDYIGRRASLACQKYQTVSLTPR